MTTTGGHGGLAGKSGQMFREIIRDSRSPQEPTGTTQGAGKAARLQRLTTGGGPRPHLQKAPQSRDGPHGDYTETAHGATQGPHWGALRLRHGSA